MRNKLYANLKDKYLSITCEQLFMLNVNKPLLFYVHSKIHVKLATDINNDDWKFLAKNTPQYVIDRC